METSITQSEILTQKMTLQETDSMKLRQMNMKLSKVSVNEMHLERDDGNKMDRLT